MNQIVKKNGISFGIGMAVFSILFTTVVYVVDLSLFTKWYFGIISLLIYLILYIWLLVKTKAALGGQMTFKEAFTTFFLAMVISGVIGTIFYFVLFNLVDPGAKEELKELTIKTQVEMFQKFDMPKEKMAEMVAEFEKQDNYSISSLLFGLAIQLCIGSIFGLILALIFKSRPTQYE